MGRKDAEPDAYNRRIFRFCAGWLERVMQAIAEAAWLLQSNRWAVGIFGPRYFSTKSFDPRGGGLCGGGASLTRRNGLSYFRIMSPRKYLAGVALSVSMLTVSWAAQRTILKALPACPDIKDFTNWFEAMEKGNASLAVDIIDGK